MNTTQKHILVVDDDENTLQSVDYVLQAGGYKVSTARDGKEGLDVLLAQHDDDERITLLITDVQMPTMNGLALLDEIRRLKIKLPVLAITGYGDQPLYSELRRRGCNHFLEKPFEDLELLRAIEGLLTSAGHERIDDLPADGEEDNAPPRGRKPGTVHQA